MVNRKRSPSFLATLQLAAHTCSWSPWIKRKLRDCSQSRIVAGKCLTVFEHKGKLGLCIVTRFFETFTKYGISFRWLKQRAWTKYLYTRKVLGNKGPSGDNDLHNIPAWEYNYFIWKWNRKIAYWLGAGGGGGVVFFLDPDTASGVRTSSLPRAYAEKCIDFDCLHKGGSIHPI